MVSTTVANADEAKTLAWALVSERLAACVQIVPITSVYRWNDVIEDPAEMLLLCKISASDFPAVEAAIRESHSYEVPEIVMTSIAAGYQGYLSWIAASTERE